MTGNDDWLLDTVVFDAMPAGTYYRVYPKTAGSPPRDVDPLDANPRSTARLALPDVGMFYVATSEAGALFEGILRNASMSRGRRVYLSRSYLEQKRLATVILLRERPVIPLGLPERRMVVTDAKRDARWRELINTPNHGDTHAAAEAVRDQVKASGEEHTGLCWPSIQSPSAKVYLLYDPPLQRTDWTLEHIVLLDDTHADMRIAAVLAKAGYVWLADPSGPGFAPGPDEDER